MGGGGINSPLLFFKHYYSCQLVQCQYHESQNCHHAQGTLKFKKLKIQKNSGEHTLKVFRHLTLLYSYSDQMSNGKPQNCSHTEGLRNTPRVFLGEHASRIHWLWAYMPMAPVMVSYSKAAPPTFCKLSPSS